jgi:phosphatidylserine decarboxylase
MIRIRDCLNILAYSILAAIALLLIKPVLALIPLSFIVFTLYFFRDPERTTPCGKNIFVSPADGKILYVEKGQDDYAGKSTRIAIFMSGFDVHVNRIPQAGMITSIRHRPGKKEPAYKRGDITVKEMNRLEVEGKVKYSVEQYAGVFARRIVCFTRVGDTLETGQRFGMIRYGSRVDLIVPEGVQVKVKEGDRVRAGETIMGELL